MKHLFVFQECHSPESFRFEGLELPYLEKWTARHRLCQPLQCSEEQWGQKYVWWRGGWRASFVGVGRRIRRHGFLSTWRINPMMLFPSGPGATVILLSVGAVCGVLGRLSASLCLHYRTQPPMPRAMVVGCSDGSPWSLGISAFPLLLPLFSQSRRWVTCRIKLSDASSLHHYFPSLSPGTEQRSCVGEREWLQIVFCA